MTNKKRTTKRIRWTLLVLLWVWAACVFTTLDLFKNVEEFDRLRPESKLYAGMRVAAHRMIGEPIATPETPTSVEITVARDFERAHKTKDEGVLSALASAGDPRVRLAALEKLGNRRALLRVIGDKTETAKMRRAAARLLGRFGTQTDLARLLEADLPPAVRGGVILGLGELGTTWAAETLLSLESAQAIARLSTPDAGAVLRPALLDGELKPETRVAICKALARIPEDASGRALADVLADPANPPTVRATAANSLGRLQHTDALLVVSAATKDTDPQVARQARLAETRLR